MRSSGPTPGVKPRPWPNARANASSGGSSRSPSVSHFAELEAAVASEATAATKLASVFRHNIESRTRYEPAFIRDTLGIPHIWERVRVFREAKASALITLILEEGIAAGEFRDMHLGHTTRLIMSFGDIVPRLYPYEDEREAERFLQSLYDFLTRALTHR